jgi:hypothetical protein
MCDYLLNLSILIRRGKETNRDSLSSGERNGISPSRRNVGLIVHYSVPCKGGSNFLAHINIMFKSSLNAAQYTQRGCQARRCMMLV